MDTKTPLFSSVLLQSFHHFFDVREWCLHDVWRPVPTRLVHLLLRLLLRRGLYLTPADSGLAQAWGLECMAGQVVGQTWSCAGGCAYTGSQASLRDQMSLSLRPYELKGISWVWLCAQIEGLRGALRIPRSGTGTGFGTSSKVCQQYKSVRG